MSLGSLLSRIVPTAIGYATGGPVGAVTSFAAVEQQKATERDIKAQNIQIEKERQRQMEIFGRGSVTSLQAPMTAPTTQQAGFGAGFGQFLGEVGRNIVSPITGLVSAVSPLLGRSEVQQPAVTTTRQIGAQESQGSGTVQGFIGGPGLGQAINAASRFLRTPSGQIGTGLGIGVATSLIGADGKPIRITRKMKSQYRSVLNLAGGDYNLAADMIGVSVDQFIMVLLKRFRNDGPVVTKAALRKTKQTVNRLKSMCDMYDSLRPAARRKTTPMRRASSTTLIKN